MSKQFYCEQCDLEMTGKQAEKHTHSTPPKGQPDQAKLLKFVTDPKTIRKAVEGSMDKRLKVLGQPSVDKLEEILTDAGVRKFDQPGTRSALLAHARRSLPEKIGPAYPPTNRAEPDMTLAYEWYDKAITLMEQKLREGYE